MHLSIVTGASKGLGEAIAKGLLEKGHVVHAFSRSKSDIRHDPLIQHEADLTQLAETEELFQKLMDSVQISDCSSITLINNAGMVEPIKRAGEAGREELRRHYDLNLLAPVILSQLFAKWLKEFPGKKAIVNISSGAAKNPYKGWSAYCSSKAGLDMFTKTFGYEQEDERHPVKVISFSPGIMDTGMQAVIRSSSKQDFHEIERFKNYQTEGKLRSTSFVAGVLLDLLETDFENGRVYDIKQFL
ncbi:(S)-benzoin forming benzil reductase [Bacillus sonorensis]|uniref:(S)-benzoin forming benzil reductase n=1 Tax=Bacillus sonorensis TaxID=119858 RepID=UPI002DBF5A1B|nr:(S)-benzoin forming benzil reductase [Bacillus sonorensis]MEC1500158.1 (S)-benzoin forming benzil reductase [Bacillus sonorensis]